MQGIWSDRKAAFGIILWCLILFFALAGPWFFRDILGFNASTIDYDALGSPPSAQHLFGTTATGQDVFAQTVIGAQGSVFVGIGVGVTVGLLSTVIGLTAAYLGGWVDDVLNGVTNVALTLAGFPLLLVIVSYLPGAGTVGMILVIALVSWPSGARVIRAQAQSLRNRDYVTSMQMVGETKSRLMFIEVLPHLFPVIAAQVLFGVIGGVFAEAGLAFLGFGASDSFSWGTMIAEVQAQGGITRGMYWWFLPPGIGIALLGMASGLINFGIDGLANPRLRIQTRSRRDRNAAAAARKAQA